MIKLGSLTKYSNDALFKFFFLPLSFNIIYFLLKKKKKIILNLNLFK